MKLTTHSHYAVSTKLGCISNLRFIVLLYNLDEIRQYLIFLPRITLMSLYYFI